MANGTRNARRLRYFSAPSVQRPGWTAVVKTAKNINYPYGVASEPVITVTGSGDITHRVGQYIICLEDTERNITIDSRLQEAYSNDELQNGKMTGDVTSVLVKLHWRTN